MTDVRAPRRLRPSDLGRLASIGLRTRKLRAALSALGIAIGVAAIVAVLGLSSSSRAGLLAEIDKLGTNLLTVTNGQTLGGDAAELPVAAPGMISRIGPVEAVRYTGRVGGVNAYRSPLIPAINTNALSVQATSLDLPAVVGTSMAQGRFLNQATARSARPGATSACSSCARRSCSPRSAARSASRPDPPPPPSTRVPATGPPSYPPSRGPAGSPPPC